MIAVVVSRADPASVHVGDRLLELADWTSRDDDRRPAADGGGEFFETEGFELRTFDGLHLHLDDPAGAFDDPELLVFVSRHSGETGPLLTAHHTGNFGPAEFGGEPGRFARPAPAIQKAVVAALDDRAPPDYDVGVECTHHGPTGVDVPSLFVELGSGEEEWADPAGARAVARAVLDLAGVENGRTSADRTVVGLGGGHYAPRFERVIRETGWAVGHVGADWALDAMGEPAANADVLDRAFERSDARLALLDGDRPELERVVESLGHRVVSETWLREADGVPLGLVAALEDALGPIDEGTRLGRPAAGSTAETEFGVHGLPSALLDEASGVDAEAAREAVAADALAFGTEEGGRRPRGRVALPAGGSDDRATTDSEEGAEDGDATGDETATGVGVAAYDSLVTGLVAVLEGKYDTVERRNGEVVARTTAFDPALARERGVPEGPAFGRLADGEAVEVDGRRVTPAEVHAERIERFPVRESDS